MLALSLDSPDPRYSYFRRLIKNPEGDAKEEREFILCTWFHVDFLLYKKVTMQLVLAIEVDGSQYHKPGSIQKEVRDRRKDGILAACGIPLLWLATTGSREEEKIRDALKTTG